MRGLILGGFTMVDLKSAGSGYRIEPPVHRTSNAENFSALELVTSGRSAVGSA